MMKKLSSFGLIAGFLLMSVCGMAKDSTAVPKNFFKVNLPGLLIRNYGVQYERVLTKRISFVLGYRLMPNGSIPMKDRFINITGSTIEAQNAINSLSISNNAITPEIRFYTGKGYGRGFYLAPFMRQANFKAAGVKVAYPQVTGGQGSLFLSGDVKGTTFGLMMGAQWALGKNICLDWFIIGPHFGRANGSLNAKPNTALAQIEQDEIRKALQELDIPFVNTAITVNANNVGMGISGPWAGLRSGLSLGIRF